MENKKSIESRLQTEKISAPHLTEAYKNRLAQKILNASGQEVSSEKEISIFHYRYLIVAALVILSLVLMIFKNHDQEMVKSEKVVLTESPQTVDAEVLKSLAEKFNPDKIGVYASFVLTADTSLNNKYQAEIKALGDLSHKIMTSFYDDFKPQKNTQNY